MLAKKKVHSPKAAYFKKNIWSKKFACRKVLMTILRSIVSVCYNCILEKNMDIKVHK